MFTAYPHIPVQALETTWERKVKIATTDRSTQKRTQQVKVAHKTKSY
jgi:hypothetical protein